MSPLDESLEPGPSEAAAVPGSRDSVPMRLQKFLARAGIASRRGSEDLMTAGRVRVNGEVVTELGRSIDPRVDAVTVDGQAVSLAGECVYLLLHKPLRVMTTMSDPQGRDTVRSLVPSQVHPGLFPVGRLDYESSGALLFITDGELGHRLLHPRWKVDKEYLVTVDGTLSDSDLEALRGGVVLDDGVTAPAEVTARKAGDIGEYTIVIREGRKRQVRRMFSAVGHPVRTLHRVRFGAVALGGLPPGEWRYLSESEVAALRESTGMSDKG